MGRSGGLVLPALAALFVASTVLTSPAAAQLADGGFDAEAASVADFCYLGGACPTTPWNGWSAGFIRSGSATWPLGTVVSGSYAAFVQGTGGLFQNFTVSASGAYRLQWWDAGRSAGSSWGGNQTYNVTINSSLVATMSTSSGQAFTHRVSAPFMLVAGTTYQLIFYGSVSADQTAFIDSVTLTPASGTTTTTYGYDALGRLVSTSVAGGVDAGVATSTTFDAADNRTNYSVTVP